jgi:hypothetical protein
MVYPAGSRDLHARNRQKGTRPLCGVYHRTTVWWRDDQPGAYSYRGLFGIGPVAGQDAQSAALALRAELAANAAEEIRVDIPGTATALVEVALEAGLNFTDPRLLLL